jgi:acetyltransferase-like isoleucine patch superfamily enzyme
MRRSFRAYALSGHWSARAARSVFRAITTFSVPAPKVITRPALLFFLALRTVYYFIARVFVCEPLFKAYCTEFGKNLHTGVSLHWVQGAGRLIVGDNVRVDGKCNFFFAARYTEHPTLTIGDNSGLGNGCSFVVGRSITIGRNCRFGANIQMFDAPGHPVEPNARLQGQPARPEDVRPIVIGDNVWIGSSSVIYPGVVIGEDSVVALGSVVVSNVPPKVIVAGNPARQIARVERVD